MEMLAVLEHYGIELNDQNKACCPFHKERTPSFVYYDDTDSYYCFGCGAGGDAIQFIIDSEELDNQSEFHKAVTLYEEITGDDKYHQFDGENIVAEEFRPEILQEIKSESSFDSKGYRGIRRDISASFGVMYQSNTQTGEIDKCFYITTKESSNGKPNIVGLKVRYHPKRWNHFGETGMGVELFGQWRYSSADTSTLVICAGEHDALAAAQMLADNTARYNKRNRSNFNPPAVVSSTVGEAGLAKQLQKNYDFINSFDKIIFIPDNDKAGEKAVEEVFDVVPKGRLHIARLPMKDVNEMLLNNKEQEFINAYFKAKPHIPDGVVDAATAFDSIEEELTRGRITLPPYMWRMQEMMNGGIIQGRICNIIAHTSVGKSTHVDRMVYHMVFNSPITPTIVTLEATGAQYMLQMLALHMEQNLRWKMSDNELVEFLKTEQGQKLRHELCFKPDGTPRFFLIDDRSGSIKDLEKQMEELYNRFACRLWITDPLSDMLRGSSSELAEDHMAWQKNMVKNGGTIINVLHTRKPSIGEDGKERPATEYDALGTGSFVQSAAYNIVLNRDKLSDCKIEKNTTEATLAKCRGGITGSAGGWYYDFNTTTCHDAEDYWTADRRAKFEREQRGK